MRATFVRPDYQDMDPDQIIEAKWKEYTKKYNAHKVLYFVTRSLAGVCLVVVPFVITSVPLLATVLSITAAVTVVVDTVVNSGSKMKTYSKATDLMLVKKLQKDGKYEEIKGIMETILDTEEKLLLDLVEMDDIKRIVSEVVP